MIGKEQGILPIKKSRNQITILSGFDRGNSVNATDSLKVVPALMTILLSCACERQQKARAKSNSPKRRLQAGVKGRYHTV